MQASHKLLRRTQRVLAAQHGDAVLAGLQQLVVQSQPQQLADALVHAFMAHKQLELGFKEQVSRDGWGVIQRAFRLMCRLWRERVSTETETGSVFASQSVVLALWICDDATPCVRACTGALAQCMHDGLHGCMTYWCNSMSFSQRVRSYVRRAGVTSRISQVHSAAPCYPCCRGSMRLTTRPTTR